MQTNMKLERNEVHERITRNYKNDEHQAKIMCMFYDEAMLKLDIDKIKFNDLKKGDRLVLLPIKGISDKCRTATLSENKRGGVTRMVHIDEANGYFGDIGSVYLDEIVAFIDEKGKYFICEPTILEKKNMMKVRKAHNKLFGEG